MLELQLRDALERLQGSRGSTPSAAASIEALDLSLSWSLTALLETTIYLLRHSARNAQTRRPSWRCEAQHIQQCQMAIVSGHPNVGGDISVQGFVIQHSLTESARNRKMDWYVFSHPGNKKIGLVCAIRRAHEFRPAAAADGQLSLQGLQKASDPCGAHQKRTQTVS